MDFRNLHYWPSTQFQGESFFNLSVTTQEIESYFDRLYHPYKTLVFSSARNSLKTILEAKGFSRADRIWLMPYTSHCVVNAVGSVASPYIGDLTLSDAVVAYHQFGFQKKISVKTYIIEDSVDSLCLNSQALFPNENSEYEIFSLPKLIGSTFGGLVVCKDIHSWERLKERRLDNNILSPVVVSLLRIAKKFSRSMIYGWEGLSIYSSGLPRFALADIAFKIKDYDRILETRNENMQFIKTKFNFEFCPSRIPTAIPLNVSLIKPEFLPGLNHLIRNIYTDSTVDQETKPVPVLLLPIHQDVDRNKLNNIINLIIK